MEARNLDEFLEFAAQHTGRSKRFLDFRIYESADVRLSHASMGDIIRYMLNYVTADPHYNEARKNCQHFAADMFSLLSGSEVERMAEVCKLLYKRRDHLFLYKPTCPGSY